MLLKACRITGSGGNSAALPIRVINGGVCAGHERNDVRTWVTHRVELKQIIQAALRVQFGYNVVLLPILGVLRLFCIFGFDLTQDWFFVLYKNGQNFPATTYIILFGNGRYRGAGYTLIHRVLRTLWLAHTNTVTFQTITLLFWNGFLRLNHLIKNV